MMENFESGYEANFQTEVSPFLKCTCCRYVLRKPMLSSKCGHRYCFQCLEKLKGYSNVLGRPMVCPADQTEIYPNEIYEDTGVEKMILELAVYCDYVDRGCDWKGTIEMLEAHVDQCNLRDPEDTNIIGIIGKLSNRLELLEKDACKNKAEIAALQEELVVVSNEAKSAKAELHDAKKEITNLKAQLENECKRFERENEKLEYKIATLEESVNTSKDSVVLPEYSPKAKKEIDYLVDQKLEEVNKKFEVMETNYTALNKKIEYLKKTSSSTTEDETGVIVRMDNHLVNVKLLLNMTKITEKEVVFSDIMRNIPGTYFDKVNRVYGRKFFFPQNGYQFRLVFDWNHDKTFFGLGAQVCGERSIESIGVPINMYFMVSFSLWKDGKTLQKDCDTEFTIQPGVENEENIYWISRRVEAKWVRSQGNPQYSYTITLQSI